VLANRTGTLFLAKQFKWYKKRRIIFICEHLGLSSYSTVCQHFLLQFQSFVPAFSLYSSSSSSPLTHPCKFHPLGILEPIPSIPDNTSIGSFHQMQLKRVTLSGGIIGQTQMIQPAWKHDQIPRLDFHGYESGFEESGAGQRPGFFR